MKSLLATTLILLASTVSVVAQGPPVATGLRAPVEVTFTRGGNLIVSEAGNGPNTGRISLIDRTSGSRRTLVDGLPSGLHVNAQPNVPPTPSGPSGLALQGSTLYVLIGGGDPVLPGPLPGTEVPKTPSSPIVSSVLALRSTPSLDVIRGDFAMTVAQHTELKSGRTVTLTNSANEELSIRLVVDFPDTLAEPRPDVPQNVRHSNPFSLAALGQTLFVADASLNVVQRVDANTGAYSTLTTFARIQNPLPIGAPVTDAVPTSVRVRGNELLVTTLTGFPFPQGLAEVRRVDLATGANQPLIGGLTSAISVRPLGDGPLSPMLVLEFSTSQRENLPGRLRLVAPGAEPIVLATGLITPVGMAVDRRSGEIFITHLGPGIITRVNAAATLPLQTPDAILPIIGSAQGGFGARFRTEAQLTNQNSFPVSGRIVFHPQGQTARPDDPALAYSLRPFETRSFPDLVVAAGGSGIGTAEVIPAVGDAPAIVVRIIDDSSSSAASLQVPLVSSSQTLHAATRGVLIAPADVARTRFNVGIRTFDSAVNLRVTQYDAAGSLVRSRTVFYPAGTFVQLPASDLVGGFVGSSHSLTLEVLGGSALVYGAATNNDGTGMTLQIVTPLEIN